MRSDQERLAGNEDAFRKRNEMLRLGQGPVGQMLLLCECGHADCTQPIRMTLVEYEQLRDHGGRFAIVKAHSIPEVERVVQRHDAYDVVEKVGEAGRRRPAWTFVEAPLRCLSPRSRSWSAAAGGSHPRPRGA